MLRRPQVYIGRVPSNVTQVMRKIIIDHGGAIMEDIASATHVVDWDEEVDSLPSELTEEFVRTLEVRPSEDSGTALVHWFYHPDSYDEWIPSDHVDGSEPPDTVPQASELNVDRQWHVCCRFVMDCEIFNEWGNEIDYENLPEGEGDDDDVNDENNQERSPVKASAGRKARGRRRLDSIKAKKVPILESITVTEKMMQDVLPPLLDPILDTATVVDMFIGNECQLTSVKYGSQRVKESSSSEAIEHEADAPEVPESQITDEPPVPPIKRKADVLTETPVESTGNAVPSVVKVKKEKSAGKKGSFQSQLKLPSWYNSESLNALEIRYLPDFFANDADRLKNSPEYFRVRNYIVSLYAHNPSVYLSATDCRRKLSGDVCVVLRIHSFLDAFGVINFNIKADCRPVIGQASLSYWSEDLLSKYTSNILYAPAGSSSAVMTSPDPASDDVDVEWSEEMDTSLRRSAVACSGDWDKVADTLTHEYSDDSEGTWKPKSEECLARFVSLSLPPPQFSGTMTEGSTGIALTSIASGPKSRKMRYLGAQVAERALSVLGRDETQRLVSSVLPGPHKVKKPFATPCCAMSYLAMACHAFHCYVILCYVMLCYSLLCHAMPCQAVHGSVAVTNIVESI